MSERIRWRKITDYPPIKPEEEDDSFDVRAVVVWQDDENPSDFGVEATTLWHIQRGDFEEERYKNCRWRSVMDAPAFKLAEKDEEEDDAGDS